jgi:ribosomal 50S subunit-recycling heat shock protein
VTYQSSKLEIQKFKVQSSDSKLRTRNSLLRLDLFLKASRLCSRRALAQKLCDAGLVSINGSSAKSSHVVKAGDEIVIHRHDQLTTLRVLSVPTARQTSRKEAASFYEVLREESLAEERV